MKRRHYGFDVKSVLVFLKKREKLEQKIALYTDLAKKSHYNPDIAYYGDRIRAWSRELDKVKTRLSGVTI